MCECACVLCGTVCGVVCGVWCMVFGVWCDVVNAGASVYARASACARVCMLCLHKFQVYVNLIQELGNHAILRKQLSVLH